MSGAAAASAQALAAGSEVWLGSEDSNPGTVVQSHVSYPWTTPQRAKYCVVTGHAPGRHPATAPLGRATMLADHPGPGNCPVQKP